MPLQVGVGTSTTNTSNSNVYKLDASTWTQPQFHMVRDYDDSTAITLNDMQQFQSYKVKTFNKPITIKVRPALSVPVYRTGIGVFGFGSKWKQWVDFVNLDVPYYAFKYGVNRINASLLSYDIRYTVYFSCRGTR